MVTINETKRRKHVDHATFCALAGEVSEATVFYNYFSEHDSFDVAEYFDGKREGLMKAAEIIGISPAKIANAVDRNIEAMEVKEDGQGGVFVAYIRD